MTMYCLLLALCFGHPVMSQVSHGSEYTDGGPMTSDEQSITLKPELDTNGPPVDFIENTVAHGLYLYGGGFLFVFGSLGNIMTMVVLWRERRLMSDKHNNTSVYLFVMALTDLIMLTLGQPLRHWTRALTGVDLATLSTWGCRMWTYIMSIVSVETNYILAGVSLERCLAIMIPLKSRRYLTRFSAILYLSITTLLTAVYVSYSLVFFHQLLYVAGGRNIKACTSGNTSYFMAKIRPWTDFTVRTIIPGAVIVLSNVIITRGLLQASHKRSKELTAKPNKVDTQFWSTAIMLLVVSVAFVVVMTPVHVIYILNIVYPAMTRASSHSAALSNLKWALVVLLNYLNNAMNFYLYVLSGRYFRSAVKETFVAVFLCKRSNATKKTSADTLQTYVTRKPISSESQNVSSSVE